MSNRFLLILKAFWEKNGQIALFVLAGLLLCTVAYRAGQTAERNRQSSEIKISLTRPESSNPQKDKVQLIEKIAGESLSGTTAEAGSAVNAGEENCQFVGSKNSNKYHLPSCRYAANIKPENKRCFVSGEEAEKSGYVGGSCCVNKK